MAVREVQADDGLFECFSIVDNHPPFFVRVDMFYHKYDYTLFERAMEIAEHELDMWEGGFEELEDEFEYLYYHDGCYGELVENALDKEGIKYEIYFRAKGN